MTVSSAMENALFAAVRETVRVVGPVDTWKDRCHEVSLAMVRTGELGTPGEVRVARGWCNSVPGQHSWVSIGDPYSVETLIVDPTRHLHTGDEGIWTGSLSDGLHQPHGWMEGRSIWEWGRPRDMVAGEDVIKLMEPEGGFSEEASLFIDLLGPMGSFGWGQLFSQAPVNGWPAAEILLAAHHMSNLSPLIPIDRLGMLTTVNPENLYW